MRFFTEIVFSIFVLLSGLNLHAQDEMRYRIGCIAFYNIENLFDTIDQPNVNDTEFTPEGPNKWNSSKYYEKLSNLSEVISKIGVDLTPDGPAVLGLSEIENRSVLSDLVMQPELRQRNYQIVHHDGPDRRGVDCALFYNPKYFTMTNSQSRRLRVEGRDNFFTRDQLVVSGMFDGEMMHFIVNHWPSRSGGQKRSEPLRIAAARLTRSIVDSLLNIDPNAKVIVMGDLNDDPVDKSVKKIMNTTDNPDKLKSDMMFNPMERLYRQGIGSLAYRDAWNLFDQLLLTQALTGNDKSTYKFYRAGVFNKPWLLQKEGAFKGYPWRSFAGGNYLGGYSDHLPVYLFLIKEEK
ncbi:MAG TPA: endonuclease/exonuclease/phosphatase family protein [Bacteroidales bacterium]|nr:endonuclease/exonuclease/phosphatase family protein [Bacteroidales bacterium]